MTARARAAVAALAAVVALGAGAYAATPASAPRPTCTRDHLIRGSWFCTFPTGHPVGAGRPARVFVQTWEDGSARVVALDPDARP